MSIIHETQTSFDSNPRVVIRSMLLAISKAIDKVCIKVFLFKWKFCGVKNKILLLLEWLECYLRDRKQRVVLNDQNSDWRKINSGAPQVPHK